jgi:hypothetical protein
MATSIEKMAFLSSAQTIQARRTFGAGLRVSLDPT